MTPEAAIMESVFMVVDKNGEEVPFKLNSAQRKIDENLTGRDLIPKARQEGVSTYFLARHTAKCLMYKNRNAVIISHDSESTQRLLTKCHYFLANLRCESAEVGRDAINTITFPKTNSKIFIGTAGSRKFGRGDTITDLHCSELAYWPDPKGVMGGLLQAVPQSGEIAVESTGNGRGNYYHNMCKRAYAGRGNWTCHFLNWQDFDEYRIPLTREQEAAVLGGLVNEWEEPELVADYGITAEQIAWRRIKLEEFDYDVPFFKQEYPLTFSECFQSSKKSLFQRVKYVPTPMWKRSEVDRDFWLLEGHPSRYYTYAIGVDPSGGVGLDNAAVQVVCLDTMEQVAEYAYDRIDPEFLGIKVAQLGKMFGECFVTVEANNHGPVTIKSLRDEGYSTNRMYRMKSGGTVYEDKQLMKLGFRTTTRTKPIMIGNLRALVASELTIHSESLRDEMTTFIEHEDGKLGADENCLDDRVMAMACCCMGLGRAGLMARQASASARPSREADPFALDSVIEEMRSGQGGIMNMREHFGIWAMD